MYARQQNDIFHSNYSMASNTMPKRDPIVCKSAMLSNIPYPIYTYCSFMESFMPKFDLLSCTSAL